MNPLTFALTVFWGKLFMQFYEVFMHFQVSLCPFNTNLYLLKQFLCDIYNEIQDLSR